MIRLGLKRRISMLAIVMSCLFLAGVAAKFQVIERVEAVFQNIPMKEGVHEYHIIAAFEPEEKALTGESKIIYTNQSTIPINTLYFHLYPNAFKTKETAPFEEDEMNRAYPKGFEAGYIQIHEVKTAEEPLNHMLMGKGDSILKIQLKKDVEPGNKIEINMSFQIKIPFSYGRFGYGENTINLGNWYPVAAVLDESGWNLDPYYAIGDPFYSDISNYRVIMMLPEEYTLASTGNLIKKENIEGKVHWTVDAKNVRDFAMVLSNKFRTLETEEDKIKIYSYHFDDIFGDLSLKAAKDSIKIFNSLFGKYPYKQFSVAAADFFVGGMEYPNVVYINEKLYREEAKEILEYVVVHETAHQWWYGVVGNNQVDEAWLDEALTEYSTLLYYEQKYGAQVKNQIFEHMIISNYQSYKSTQKNMKENIYRSLCDFKDAQEYQSLVYHKGAMFMEELRKSMGDEYFFQALKIYYDKYKYKNAKTEDFIEVCEKTSNKDLEGIFKEWIKYDKE